MKEKAPQSKDNVLKIIRIPIFPRMEFGLILRLAKISSTDRNVITVVAIANTAAALLFDFSHQHLKLLGLRFIFINVTVIDKNIMSR